MKRQKRIVSIVMTIVMVVSLFTGLNFGTMEVQAQETVATRLTFEAGTDQSGSGYSWNGTTNVLTLSGAVFEHGFVFSTAATIVLEDGTTTNVDHGNSDVSATRYCGIYTNKNLQIIGNGTLNITNTHNESGSYFSGIWDDLCLTIGKADGSDCPAISVDNGNNTYDNQCIFADTIRVNNGVINLTASSASSYYYSIGMNGSRGLTINNGAIHVEAKDAGKGSVGLFAERGKLQINGGVFSIAVGKTDQFQKDTYINSVGIYSKDGVEITGGTILVQCKNEGAGTKSAVNISGYNSYITTTLGDNLKLENCSTAQSTVAAGSCRSISQADYSAPLLIGQEVYDVTPVSGAAAFTVSLAQAPSGTKVKALFDGDYKIKVYKTGDPSTVVESTEDTFIMPSYPVSVTLVKNPSIKITGNDNTSSYGTSEGKTFSISDSGYDTAPTQYEAAWCNQDGTTDNSTPSAGELAIGTVTEGEATLTLTPSATALPGTYYFKVTDGNGEDAVSSKVMTYTITKAANSVTDPEITGWAYGETEQNPVATADHGTVSYQYYTDNNNAKGTQLQAKPVNAGTYWVEAIVPETNCYQSATSTNAVKFVIDQRELTVTAGTYQVSKEYNGNTNPGTASGTLAVEGILQQDSGVSVTPGTIPAYTGSAIGSGYTVAVPITITGDTDGNYKLNSSTITVPAEITKVKGLVYVAIEGWTYGEDPSSPSYTMGKGCDYAPPVYLYKVEGAPDSTYTTTVPTQAGEYRVRANFAETNDFGATYTETTFTIGRATLDVGSVTVAIDDTEYGTELEPFVTGNTMEAAVTYTYSDAENGSYTATVPTEPGRYWVKATLAAGSNYNTASVTNSFYIVRKMLTVKWSQTSFVYNGTRQQPTATLVGIKDGETCNAGVTMVTEATPINAGTYIIKANATLTGTDSSHYKLPENELANRKTFTIEKAPVTFTVTNNLISEQAQSKVPEVTSSVAGITPVLTYKDSKGNEIASPSAVGTYSIYAQIPEEKAVNYRHSSTGDGSAVFIGNLTIYGETTPETYDLTFDISDADGTAPNQQTGIVKGNVVTLPTTTGFSKDGYVFKGWSYENSIYGAGAAFTMPGKNVTLSAEWVKAEHSVTGTVKQKNGEDPLKLVSGAILTLMKGTEKIADTVSDDDGNYSFERVAPGLYNLVAEYQGITQTIAVEMANTDVQGQEVVLPEKLQLAVVEVGAGTPDTVVGGLEDSFPENPGNSGNYTQGDQAVVASGGSVEIRFIADAKEPEADSKDKIDQALTNTGLYMDLSVFKTVLDQDGAEVSDKTGNITESSVLYRVTIWLSGELQHKPGYSVVRVHNGVLQKLTTTANADGEFYSLNEDKTQITLNIRKFSPYAIGYTESGDTDYAGAGSSTTVSVTGGSITAPKTTVLTKKGDTISLEATVFPENATNKTITWTSTNPKVATVDENGVVTAVANGTTLIQMTGADGTVLDTIQITVKIPAASVVPKELSLLLTKGIGGKNSIRLTWLKNKEADGYEVYWSYCNGENNYTKLVTTTKLTYTHKNLNTKKNYKYYVKAYKKVKGKIVYLSKSPSIHVAMSGAKHTNIKAISVKAAKVVMAVKSTYTIIPTASVYNKAKEDLQHTAKYRYYTTNKAVAAVNSDGKITAKKTGTCYVYVVANNGVYRRIKVTVK